MSVVTGPVDWAGLGAHLNPLAQLFAVREDLHAGLGVGVERRLEAQLLEAEAAEEQVQLPDQVAQRQAPVAHHPCTGTNKWGLS